VTAASIPTATMRVKKGMSEVGMCLTFHMVNVHYVLSHEKWPITVSNSSYENRFK
jgi:hypothetical protein